MSDSLQALFRPNGLAVIGSSAKPGKLGFTIFKNIRDAEFGGPVIPVNPKGEAILSLGVQGNDRTAELRVEDVLEDRESQLPRLRGGADDGKGVGAKKSLQGVTHVAPRDLRPRSLSRQGGTSG